MRRLVSILFLSLMLLQAIPVLHFFFEKEEVFYAYIDEEKPDDKSKEKKAGKEFLLLPVTIHAEETTQSYFVFNPVSHYTSPLLEYIAPPPDAC